MIRRGGASRPQPRDETFECRAVSDMPTTADPRIEASRRPNQAYHLDCDYLIKNFNIRQQAPRRDHMLFTLMTYRTSMACPPLHMGICWMTMRLHVDAEYNIHRQSSACLDTIKYHTPLVTNIRATS